MKQTSKVLGGILLVSGTTIGAGMLALPVCTGMAGFIPSILLFLLYWVYMTFTAFLMLEANLWMGKGANLISIAKNTLGKGGEILSWITYLFLLYSLTTAYIAGSGPIVSDVWQSLTGHALPAWVGALPLLGIFGFFVYKGTKSVDLVNRILMVGLAIAFFLMTIFVIPYINPLLLAHHEWKYILGGVSVVATSFGFHIVIPTLVTYLEGDVAKLKKVILIGSLLPLIVYIIWEFLTLGIIPIDGPNGIVDGFHQGANGAHLLTLFLGNTMISIIARFFSFFAIVTSFLGVSMSLFDFLADGFRINKTRNGRIFLYLLTFAPPLLITLWDPRAFLSALAYAGAFGVVILLGFLPAMIVWWGRYRKNWVNKSSFTTPGGKGALLIAMILSLSIMALEIANKLGWINTSPF